MLTFVRVLDSSPAVLQETDLIVTKCTVQNKVIRKGITQTSKTSAAKVKYLFNLTKLARMETLLGYTHEGFA